MRRLWAPEFLLTVLAVLLLAGLFAWSARPRTWERPLPLSNPLTVAGIEEGTIILADGRAFRPAGVMTSASPDDLDQALKIATVQGVVIDEDFGDGSARLTVEPKFYNWCGNGRLAGHYLPIDLSAVLVDRGYAVPDPVHGSPNRDHAALLQAIRNDLFCDAMFEISEDLMAFTMGCNELFLSDADSRQFLASDYLSRTTQSDLSDRPLDSKP